jgi:tetratricopeptide (TPR) repeat protein
MRVPGILLATLLFAVSSDAGAEWLVASSDHFVIYADDSERDIRRFSERLERYRSAMDFAFANADSALPSPSNRVTIYVVRNTRAVRELFGEGSQYIGGFYIPRAGGSLAIIPPLSTSSASDSQSILMHEYAHHYMSENVPYLVPYWYSEGFAEYFATAGFGSSGNVDIGLPAFGRLQDLRAGISVELEELFDSKTFLAQRSTRDGAGAYARGWLLVHYLYSNPEGRRKMVEYLARINTGETELEAATAAFGDLEQLDRDLRRYLNQRSMAYWSLAAENLKTGTIDVRALNAGEAAIMPIVIRSKRGVDEQLAAEVVVDAREVAAEYPDEPAVQAALAEAEYDAGNDAAAIAAADKALAGNPANMTALMQKGYALVRIATASGSTEDWTQARRHFLAVNKVEADHPLPLVYFFLTFALQNLEPSQNAVDGLEWALQLAPYDNQVRMLAAQQQMTEERYADAIVTIRPMAYNPHIGEENPALVLLKEAEAALAEQVAGEKSGSETN